MLSRVMKESISFGEFIDIIIRLKHKLLEPEKGLTDYISKNLATHSGLSGRQIQRMRTYQEEEFPEGEAMTKLITALPELEPLRPKDICNRLLLPWENMEKDQNELGQQTKNEYKNNKITIVAGWEPPQGLLNQEIAISIANNIVNNFQYEFIFPSTQFHPFLAEEKAEILMNKWQANLSKVVEIEWYSQQSEKFRINNRSIEDLYNLDINDRQEYDLESELRNFKDKLTKNLIFNNTPLKTNFWLLMPSPYVVLYNLNSPETNPLAKFGVFLSEGLIVRQQSDEFPSVVSQGWLYISDERYQKIEQEYKNIQPECKIKVLTEENK